MPEAGRRPTPVGTAPPARMQFVQVSSAEIPGAENADGRLAAERGEVDDDGGLSGEKLLNKYRAWETAKNGERHEQLVSWQYYHGRQWSPEQIAVLRQRKQLPTYYNRIRRKINFLVGTEQRLRRDPKGFARHPQGAQDADVATHVLRFVQEKTRSQAAVSAAALDFFVAGIGVLYQGAAAVGNVVDPNKIHIPASRFIYDPRSERHDFSDAKFIGLWQWIETDTAIEMMEALGNKEAADKVRGLSNHHAHGYGGVPAEWAKSKVWVDAEVDSVKLIELYYRHRGQWRVAYLVGDVKLHDQPSVYLAEDGTSRHPFTATSCNIDEEGDRYGIVRDMIPVQDQINHRLSKLLHLMSTRQLIYEKGAFPDPRAAHQAFAQPDGRIEVNPGVLERKAFLIQQAETEIAGQAELLQSAISEIENVGPNPGLVGRGDGINTQSGRAILAQQNAGMTELSPEFERIREWKLRTYMVDWACCRQFWTHERFIRITARDGSTQFVGLNQIVLSPETGVPSLSNAVPRMDVDIILNEGPDTITVREEMLQTFAQLGESAVGPLGKVIIELSNVPDKDRLLGLIDGLTQPPPQMVELQQRMATLEAALKEAQVGKAQADTAAQHAATENKRADTLVKMASIMAPPQVLDQSFPRAFSDVPGVEAPEPMAPPPEAFGIDPAFVAQDAQPGPGGPPGGPGGPFGGPPPGAPVAEPGTDPRLGQPGTLPMPPLGVLPAQPPVDAFAGAPVAEPGTDPRLGQPGTLPMPPPGVLPAQPPVDAFAGA